MKIGVLTFHYSINQGSVLQAFCVRHLLKQWFPLANIEIINIVPFMREKYELKFYNRKFPFIQIEKYRKYKSIRSFTKKNLNLSERVYYNNIQKQITYINKQNYDLICTGSDTVWVDTVKLKHMIPNIYFLPTSLDAQKMSLAASVDPLNNSEPYFKRKELLKEIFDDYRLITVRDKITQDLISQFTNKEVTIIADPTILFDFEKYLQLKRNKNFQNSRTKKIGIAISDHQLTDLLKKKLSKYGEVYNSFYNKNSNFDYVIDELNSYHQLDILITDRFHRSIFALKLSTALIIHVERENKNRNKNSKGRELFLNIGIPEYALRHNRKSENEFMHQVENVILKWNDEAYALREEKFREYIHKEKKKWTELKNNLKTNGFNS